jgi:hypothetical protein
VHQAALSGVPEDDGLPGVVHDRHREHPDLPQASAAADDE